MPALLEDAATSCLASFRRLIERLLEHLKELDRQVDEFEAQIKAWHRGSELSRKLEKIPGIGPLTRQRAGRHRSPMRTASTTAGSWPPGWAWCPRQDSSGGKPKLLGISKRGDVVPANAADPRRALGDPGGAAQGGQQPNVWLASLLSRRHPNVAAVALANKNARTVWALLAHEPRVPSPTTRRGLAAA